MSSQQFEVVLEKPQDVIVTYFTVPFNVEQVFGTRGQVKVKGTIDGTPYRTSIQPMGDGTHSMMVTKAILTVIGKAVGDTIRVTMEIDTDERVVITPEDFQLALEENERAKQIYDKFPYSHRKAYVDWIDSAKKEQTRIKRIKQAVVMIVDGKKLS
ncbi:MAG: DUF1905 domain-containing protein [Anaerolineae bacterium]|nr:DUF1905 domain-containing protein [Anaerolineae bacterium]